MLCLGLMSGTSLDGIDVAIIDTDGEIIREFGAKLYKNYDPSFQKKLADLIENSQGDWLLIEKELTELHAAAVKELLVKADLRPEDISVIGFHGQTIIHRPREGISWQLGNGALLCELTGIDVVNDFRRRDIAAGGQGAPLVPIFHKAIMLNQPKPCAVLNLGGVSNITFIDKNDNFFAFDTGPANAIINDACRKYFNIDFDDFGNIAASGATHNGEFISKLLSCQYFKLPFPKSLDRNEFKSLIEEYEKTEQNPNNIITTLTKFAADAITYGIENTLPELPKNIYIAGGGAKNNSLVSFIKQSLPKSIRIENIKTIGLDPDFLEAEAFAYLAARCIKGLPISYPTTTGNRRALSGGCWYRC